MYVYSYSTTYVADDGTLHEPFYLILAWPPLLLIMLVMGLWIARDLVVARRHPRTNGIGG